VLELEVEISAMRTETRHEPNEKSAIELDQKKAEVALEED
jgi:hypothetical protein